MEGSQGIKRPDMVNWRFDLSQHGEESAEGIYDRHVKEAIENNRPLCMLPEIMDEFVESFQPRGSPPASCPAAPPAPVNPSSASL